MVEASTEQAQAPALKAAEKQQHPQKSGIDAVTDERALTVIDKVIDKLVRVSVSDGRLYLGKLMAIDQTKTVFIQDALELFDKEDEHYIEHELLTCHLIKESVADQRYFLKMMGNLVVPGHHVVKIQLDRKFQAQYDEHTKPKLPPKTKKTK